ncbi:MAG: leucine-rich repeat protein [Lachnospiraceae bacterium]|nr:leucine-rich repeat protein [Lachnospiraceae bacterium]
MKLTYELRDAIDSYKDGNKEVFLTIYEETKGYVYICIINILKDENKSETVINNIMKETFETIRKELNNFDDIEGFFDWVSKIVNEKVNIYLGKIEEYKSEVNNIVAKKPKSKKTILAIFAIALGVCVLIFTINLFKGKDEKEVNTKENVITPTVLTVPEGCIYYSSIDAKNYVYGEPMPKEPVTGDVYYTKDYRYNYSYTDKWGVMVRNKTNAQYEPILDYILEEPIATMYGTFADCENLIEAPKIPATVTNLNRTFYNCINLTKVPVIPDNVKSLNDTFVGCTSLKNPPKIPLSVNSLSSTFANCTSLIEAPEISTNVRYMSETFKNCKSLSGDIVINALISIDDEEYYRSCFEGINIDKVNFCGTSKIVTYYNDYKNRGRLLLVNGVIPDGCQYYSKMLNTYYNEGSEFPMKIYPGDRYYTGSYVYEYAYTDKEAQKLGIDISNGWNVSANSINKKTYEDIPENVLGIPVVAMNETFMFKSMIKTAPKIPSTVKWMKGTFAFCTNLETAPVIPENVEYIGQIFYYCKNLNGEIRINSKELIIHDHMLCEIDNIEDIILTGSFKKLAEIVACNDTNCYYPQIYDGGSINITIK